MASSQDRSLFPPSFRRFWPPIPAMVAAGVLSAYYFGLTGTFWAVTGEFTRWGGHILRLFGAKPETWGYFQLIGLEGAPWDRIDGWVVLGMLAGAFAAALIAGNVKLRVPRNNRRLVQGFVGGLLSGFGARLSMGCNLAALFTGVPQFTLHAWLFTLATAYGTYIGVKAALHPALKPRATVVTVSRAEGLLSAAAAGRSEGAYSRSTREWAGIAVLVAFVAAALSVMSRNPVLTIAGLFGIAFGVIIQRSQLCFTSAFRDLWVTGRANMAKGLVLGMAAATIGTASYINLGVAPKVFWAGPGVIIGGLLFGFGIVLAGGCETGWMYRTMEGQVHFWVVGLGNVAGAAFLAWAWDGLGLYTTLVDRWPRVNLIESLGWTGSLVFTYGLFALMYWFLHVWEKRRSYTDMQEPERTPRRVAREVVPGV